MRHTGTIVVLFVTGLAACPDNGGAPTTSSTTTPPLTEGAPNGTIDEASGTTAEEPTTADPDGTTMSADTTITAPDPNTGGASGGPVFLSFSSNVTEITDGESVKFTAILTDPDGIDDIVGGSLRSEDGSIDLGPFVAAGQPGTYSITLSWAEFDQAEPIQFEEGELPRTFQARFFDQMAHEATETAQITLACAGGGACDGVCKDLATDAEHCGDCGHACEDGCADSACIPAWSECFSYGEGLDSCDQMCGTLGEACVENGCGMGSTVRQYSSTQDCEVNFFPSTAAEPCAKLQEWGADIDAVRCCCTDSG